MDTASLIESKPSPNIPDIAPGDMVKVSARIVEGERQHTQLFQGVVIKIRRSADGGNFTVRRVTYGVGVERTFPLRSPLVEKVEIVRHGKYVGLSFITCAGSVLRHPVSRKSG